MSCTADGASRLALTVVALAAVLTGCNATAVREAPPVAPALEASYLDDKPAELRPLYQKVLREGKRNFVLNQMEAGLAAMDLGHTGLAEYSFDEALNEIETVYANNESAEKARSLWYSEGSKDFKGEPYERAMAFYYRGLLYLKQGDYENARASFKGGLLQDAFAEEDQNRADFALLIFLQGWASQQLGDRGLAQEAYEEVQRLRPGFVPPNWEDNTLVVVETGNSPRKLSDGVGHYELLYRPGRNFTEAKAQLSFAGETVEAYPMESIFWQAASRGGRPVDRIIQGKVKFKSTAESIGTGLTEVGSAVLVTSPAMSGVSDSAQQAGLALGLIGVVSLAVSANARPEADTRYWHGLPDTVHVHTLRTRPPGPQLEVTYLNAKDVRVDGLQQKIAVDYDPRQKGLAWVRSRPVLKH